MRGRDAAPVVSDLGERALVERIRLRVPESPSLLPVGIGDDAAVAVPDRGALQVLTTDALVEGVHFDLRFSSPADIGHKALAVNASDIAAMGGTPRLALLSLMLPPDLAVTALDELVGGFLGMAAQARVAVAGGNIARSPGPLIVDVMLTGAVRPRRILTRGGARAGDALFLTGSIGAAAAGLAWLRASGGAPPPDAHVAECVARHQRPEPRLRIGAILGRTRAASACMDLSDGLADAVEQLASSSGTGAVVEAASIPVHPAAAEWFTGAGQDPIEASVAGGDDYELLFAVPKRSTGRLRHVVQQSRGVAITRIGEVTSDGVVRLRFGDGRSVPMPSGFRHFAPGPGPGRFPV